MNSAHMVTVCCLLLLLQWELSRKFWRRLRLCHNSLTCLLILVGRLRAVLMHNILQARASRPFSTVQNNIQDPPPRWILMIFKLKFGGENLFSSAMTSTIEGNNSVGSLLKEVILVVGSRMLCGSAQQLLYSNQCGIINTFCHKLKAPQCSLSLKSKL
jgi:hypothetical protein